MGTSDKRKKDGENLIYKAELKEEYKGEGCEAFYQDGKGNAILPLGTYSIEETKAPKGYLLKRRLSYEARRK